MLMLSGAGIGAGRKVDAARAFRPLRIQFDEFVGSAKAQSCANAIAQFGGFVDAYNQLLSEWGHGDVILAGRLTQFRAQLRARCHK
jgi:hypothetical protein